MSYGSRSYGSSSYGGGYGRGGGAYGGGDFSNSGLGGGLQNRRSSTCYGKASGTLLTEYDTEQDAQSGAAFVLERYGKSMVPYQCDECRFWHLSPMMDRRVVHSSSCYGKVSGKALAQYDTKHDAQSAAANVLKEHRKKMVP